MAITSKKNPADAIFLIVTAAASFTVIIFIAAILYELIHQSGPAISRFGVWKFLSSTDWNPVKESFGALTNIYGTILTTFLSLLMAIPVAIGIAVFITEIAPNFLKTPIGVAIELLAAIPSIIYGMWGLFVFAPFMAKHVQPFLGKTLGWLPLFQGPPMGIGMLTAGIILALMILPFVAAVCRDVFQLVPSVMKESAYGVGATVWEVTHKVTIRYGLRGIVGAAFLGLGRALGETMAVTFVIGNDHSISPSLFAAGNSIASALANEFTEASDPIYLSALVELGLVLFVITFLVQIAAQFWLSRLQRTVGGGP